jgi:hypothetical protein
MRARASDDGEQTSGLNKSICDVSSLLNEDCSVKCHVFRRRETDVPFRGSNATGQTAQTAQSADKEQN